MSNFHTCCDVSIREIIIQCVGISGFESRFTVNTSGYFGSRIYSPVVPDSGILGCKLDHTIGNYRGTTVHSFIRRMLINKIKRSSTNSSSIEESERRNKGCISTFMTGYKGRNKGVI
jgi:hypothetical protein